MALHSAAALGATPLVGPQNRREKVKMSDRDCIGRIPLHFCIFSGHTDTNRSPVLCRIRPVFRECLGLFGSIFPLEIAGARSCTFDFEGSLSNLQRSTERLEYFDNRTRTTGDIERESRFVLEGEVEAVLCDTKMDGSGLQGLRLLQAGIVITPVEGDIDAVGRCPMHVGALVERLREISLVMRRNAPVDVTDRAGNSNFHSIPLHSVRSAMTRSRTSRFVRRS
jgi:hypothetical protein